jgi:hypothetical protein
MRCRLSTAPVNVYITTHPSSVAGSRLDTIQEHTMDHQDFDRLTRAISSRFSRRTLAGLFGLSAVGLGGAAEAKKKKKKKKVKRNQFGCVNVGKFCKNDGQCCSGICKGKKGKKKCKRHDESTCQPGQDFCLGVSVPCTTTAGFNGECTTTTGKAPYCFEDGQ